MSDLIIRNIGPIKNISITLNKVNVIIGPQSSGKSTINKIACYCSWVEKKSSLDQSFDYFLTENSFLNNLITFHKLEGYFKEGSFFSYKSESINIEYNYPDTIPTLTWVDDTKYKRSKLSYIPAERNIISIISDWKEVSLPDNNIRNFMGDWNIARQQHKFDQKAHIPSLMIDYYFNDKNNIDSIINKDGSKTSLINASSGIQSYVPLYILVDYFTNWIYNNEEPRSVASQEKDLQIYTRIKNDISKKFKIDPDTTFTEILNKSTNDMSQLETVFIGELIDKFRNFIGNNSTKLYIEEPELNLFPDVQKKVLYYLIKSIKERRNDTIIITTHSPYILYSLNNCILGWITQKEMPEDIKESLESRESWIDPNLVSAWQIKDGELFSIQEKYTRTIEKHYFNDIMNNIMDEYYMMLNFFNKN